MRSSRYWPGWALKSSKISELNNLVLYLVTVLIWGSTWIVIRYQLGMVAPELSLAYRFGLAALLLFVWCGFRRISLRFSPRDHIFVLLQGAFLFSMNYLLIYWATATLTTGLIAVLFSTVIFMNIVNSAVFLKRKIQAAVFVGALVGMAGIVLVFWPELSSGGLGASSLQAILLTLGGTLLASFGNVLSARNQAAGVGVVASNTLGMAYGAVLSLLLTLVSGKPVNFEWTTPYVGSLLYLSVAGSVIAFGAYLTLVGRIGADRAAYSMVLFPVVALELSHLFEGYQWHSLAIFGVLLVLVGNLLVIRWKAG